MRASFFVPSYVIFFSLINFTKMKTTILNLSIKEYYQLLDIARTYKTTVNDVVFSKENKTVSCRVDEIFATECGY